MSKGLSLETVYALTGRTIIRVGEKGLHLDNGKAIYLSDDEIESLNDYHAPDEKDEKPKGRYAISFSERNAIPEAVWQHTSTEYYEKREDVVNRFNKAVQACQDSIDSVNIVVTDTKRLAYEIPDEEILCFTKIVD